MSDTTATISVPFLDLQASIRPIADDLDAVWRAAVDSNGFIGGTAVEAFESAFGAFCGASHCVGVGNGTDALEITLIALGIGRGDEVVVPANTFFATAEAVRNVGADVVFADVDPDTLLLGTDDVRAVVTDRTAAVIAVHLYGQPCDTAALAAYAAAHGLVLIEDAAQAHGASLRGDPIGTHGVAATFSFYPGKNLGAFGDGGAVITRDPELAATIRAVANHGLAGTPHVHTVVGRNSRLDALQAGVLSARLPHLDAENARRREVRLAYEDALTAGTLVTRLPDRISSNHLIVAQFDDRDAVRARLAERGVGTALHYPNPCHTQPAFGGPAAAGAFPVTEAAAARLTSLPAFGRMTDGQLAHVCEQLSAL